MLLDFSPGNVSWWQHFAFFLLSKCGSEPKMQCSELLGYMLDHTTRQNSNYSQKFCVCRRFKALILLQPHRDDLPNTGHVLRSRQRDDNGHKSTLFFSMTDIFVRPRPWYLKKIRTARPLSFHPVFFLTSPLFLPYLPHLFPSSPKCSWGCN